MRKKHLYALGLMLIGLYGLYMGEALLGFFIGVGLGLALFDLDR
jgi:uncharacterized membrane protein YiaA